tara:strand:+ start:2437 stop:2667 length:231 start_codon:yes stop_codon:yes gene_type:complete
MSNSFRKDYRLVMSDLHDHLPKDGALERTIEEHYRALVSGYFEEDDDGKDRAILFLRKARQTLESLRDLEKLIVVG